MVNHPFHSHRFTAMGSTCSIHLHDANKAGAELVTLCAQAEIARIEQRYSRYRTDNLLSAINRVAANGGWIDLDEETLALLNYARTCFEKSEGLFDVTSGVLHRAWNFTSESLPEASTIENLLTFVGFDKLIINSSGVGFSVPGMEIDFGGICKEYAADRAASICAAGGYSNGLIDLGGDIRIIGPHKNGKPWQIDIRNPFTPDSVLLSVELSEGGLATSGDYARKIEIDGKRYGHLLNPRTGFSAHGLSSVSVAASTCLVAGSLASIAMLRGLAGVGWLSTLDPTIRHLWINSDGVFGGTLINPPPF